MGSKPGSLRVGQEITPAHRAAVHLQPPPHARLGRAIARLDRAGLSRVAWAGGARAEISILENDQERSTRSTSRVLTYGGPQQPEPSEPFTIIDSPTLASTLSSVSCSAPCLLPNSGANLDARAPEIYNHAGGAGALLLRQPPIFSSTRGVKALLRLSSYVATPAPRSLDAYDLTGDIGAPLFGQPEGYSGTTTRTTTRTVALFRVNWGSRTAIPDDRSLFIPTQASTSALLTILSSLGGTVLRDVLEPFMYSQSAILLAMRRSQKDQSSCQPSEGLLSSHGRIGCTDP
ncbi:unnamed protein product [Peniophora sp. CBMAI 1063]|nr:unnamed protein product [Peniophora sp. CBMAI 1063]